ncbi:MAG: 6-phospho-3-hexuloisomerase [Thermoplasmata archaeon]|nr:MAG: 6-phospho-3-hexuloisomerase [Thermoplasmata archaeon]
MKKELIRVVEKIKDIVDEISEDDLNRIVNEIKSAKRIFVVGAGSSKLVGYIFANRLFHAGYEVHVMEESTLPFLTKEDLIVVISGSGETLLCVKLAEASKKIGCRVISITSHPESRLAMASDVVIRIRGREELPKDKDYLTRVLLGEYEPIGTEGLIFEIATIIFLEVVTSYAAKQ